MAARHVHLRTLAAADVESAIGHLQESAGAEVARGFVDDLEREMTRLSRSPHAGSLRFAHPLSVPELRIWRLSMHPYLIFYVAEARHIDVWRVLHERRDVPAVFQREA